MGLITLAEELPQGQGRSNTEQAHGAQPPTSGRLRKPQAPSHHGKHPLLLAGHSPSPGPSPGGQAAVGHGESTTV